MVDVAVIGAGVVGCAVAYKLSQYKLNVCVIEKENDIAMGATRANSAIIHAGFDPEPGTLMARLNVSGCAQAPELCRKLGVPYKPCGSMVLAFSEEDKKNVQTLFERGQANGVPGLAVLSGDEVRKREPHVSENVLCALYAPSSGIINPWEYAIAFAETAAVNGTKFCLEERVEAIEQTDGLWRIRTSKQTIDARFVINAAGVHSDEIHNMVSKPSFRMIPSKGQYYLMDKAEGEKVGCTLFQCPSKVGKGVLVSPTVHGNLIVGPDATVSDDRDRVNTTGAQLSFVRGMAAKSVPDINYRNTIRTFAGMRANTDQSDFVIGFAAPRFLDLAGIKSPGLSAAPAIADEAIRLLSGNGLSLSENKDAVSERKHIVFKDLSSEEKEKAIRENPLYGRVICRCETITEGEIVDAIHSPIPARTVDGVKRRCNAGMGRCQGGFCGPKVVEILAREMHCSPLEIKKDTGYILVSETKGGEIHD